MFNLQFCKDNNEVSIKVKSILEIPIKISLMKDSIVKLSESQLYQHLSMVGGRHICYIHEFKKLDLLVI